mmetsp:Transcript_5119/g.7415  ORF Transcript_5119/g.7415 Transcript_5119/m.7415 type:complete len:92 (+) Transcript_5119:590-865(+)
MKMMLSALPPPPIVLPKHNPHSSHDNSVDSDNESDTKRNVSRWHHSKMQTPLYGNLTRELSSVNKNPYLSLADIATNTGIPLFNVLVLKMM